MALIISEAKLSAIILDRADGFSQWLSMVGSLLPSSSREQQPELNIANMVQTRLNIQSDAPIVLFNSDLKVDEHLIYDNASHLLRMELQDWIEDETLWPQSLDFITFSSFFEPSQFNKVFTLHTQNEKLLTPNELKGDKYAHHFSLHIICTEQFIKFINQSLIKQTEIPLKYDAELAQFLNEVKYLYLLPDYINSYEQVTQCLKENYILIHQSFLKFVLKKPPTDNTEISYEQFTSFYRFFYHSRVTTFTDVS